MSRRRADAAYYSARSFCRTLHPMPIPNNPPGRAARPRRTSAPVPVVQLSGLRKSYGSTRAVDGVYLRIDSGERLALLRPNGAGKSTTVDLLLGLIRPDAGTASLFGVAPRAASAQGRVGAMLQSGGLL